MGEKPILDPRSLQRMKAKIRGGDLIWRLQTFALGNPYMEPDGHGGFRIMVRDEEGTARPGLTAEQIKAAKLLLDKLIPNPQSLDVNTSRTTTFVLRAPEPSKDTEEWLNQYGPKTIEGKALEPSGLPNPAHKLPS